MNLAIIFPNKAGGISVLYKMPNCEMSYQDLAQKDVPSGVPYLFVPVQALPQDHMFFDAFEADFTNPDGHGLGPEEWFALQEQSKETKEEELPTSVENEPIESFPSQEQTNESSD